MLRTIINDIIKGKHVISLRLTVADPYSCLTASQKLNPGNSFARCSLSALPVDNEIKVK